MKKYLIPALMASVLLTGCHITEGADIEDFYVTGTDNGYYSTPRIDPYENGGYFSIYTEISRSDEDFDFTLYMNDRDSLHGALPLFASSCDSNSYSCNSGDYWAVDCSIEADSTGQCNGYRFDIYSKLTTLPRNGYILAEVCTEHSSHCISTSYPAVFY